jgi:hypothetical protein
LLGLVPRTLGPTGFVRVSTDYTGGVSRSG